MARRRARRLATVTALPGHERPEHAAKYVMEAAATGKLAGVVFGIVMDDGDVNVATCGVVKRDELVWVGTRLQHMGMEE